MEDIYKNKYTHTHTHIGTRKHTQKEDQILRQQI